VYDIFVPENRPKTSSFWLPYQCHGSSAHYARDLSRSSKVSQDSDCGLVSNKNFSKIPNGSGLEPGEVGQGWLKVLHLWGHSQKIHNPQPKKIFFSCKLKDLPSFECLNSSPVLLAPELHSRKAMCDLAVLARNAWNRLGVKMLMSWLDYNHCKATWSGQGH